MDGEQNGGTQAQQGAEQQEQNGQQEAQQPQQEAQGGASGGEPGIDATAYETQMASVAFAADMANFSYINMNYWFYGLNAITSFTGIANLANVHEMQYTFSSCSGLTSLDFRGFDPSTLTNLFLTFGSCSNLVTIYADSSWALASSGEAESVVRPQSSGLLDKQLNFVATKWRKKVDDFILLCGKVLS